MDSARTATDSHAIGNAAHAVARKLLLTGAAVVSLDTGTWTTDRIGAAQWLKGAQPQRTDDIDKALRWADPASAPDVHLTELHEFIDGFGVWLLRELDAALQQST